MKTFPDIKVVTVENGFTDDRLISLYSDLFGGKEDVDSNKERMRAFPDSYSREKLTKSEQEVSLIKAAIKKAKSRIKLADGKDGRDLSFPDATKIEHSSFVGSSVETIDLPKVTHIGTDAFLGATDLKSVNAPLVTTIEEGAFSDCHSLELLSFENLTEIGPRAFLDSSLGAINAPLVTTIGEKAFKGCDHLMSVNFKSLTNIGPHTFGHSGLDRISLPKIASVERSAFSDARKLENVAIPRATVIEDSAFAHCHSLKTVRADSLTRIERKAFYHSGLKELYAPNVKYVGRDAFGDSDIEVLELPKAELIESRAFTRSSLRAISIGDKDQKFITTLHSPDAFSKLPPGFMIYVPEHLFRQYLDSSWGKLKGHITFQPSI